LRHARGRRVLVAFDADKAGDRAAKEGAAAQAMQRELWGAGAIDVVRRKPVGFKDWAELAAARLGFGRGAL
jgi:DNA primase